MVTLVTPARGHLARYIAALETGWSPDNLRPAAAQEQLAAIARDADGFLASLIDLEARGGPVNLPDGRQAPRLPGFRLWMWDGDFCGSIGLRFQPGTSELPAHVLGHIGYAVVPWKRRQGIATDALRQMLIEADSKGLAYVLLTADPGNAASQKVILNNGGVLVKAFTAGAEYGFKRELLFRIDL